MAWLPTLAASVLWFAGAQAAGAQAPAATGGVFRSATELVTLSVTVTDAHDRQLTGLGPGDFVLLEDGRPQRIRFFASAEVPFDVVLLVDTSSSMSDKLEPSRLAAARFLRSLRPADRAAVVEFNTRVRILQPFTNDRGLLERGLSAARARGSTALYTGIYVALDHLARLERTGAEVRRSAIVVLSDGQDTASLIAEADLTERARRAGVPLYFVSLLSAGQERQLAERGGRRRTAPHDFVLRNLAAETGGRAFLPNRLEELEGVYDTVARELSLQYTLAYAPAEPSGEHGRFRRILVRVPGHPGARPRTRAGYYTAGVSARHIR